MDVELLGISAYGTGISFFDSNNASVDGLTVSGLGFSGDSALYWGTSPTVSYTANSTTWCWLAPVHGWTWPPRARS